MTPKVMQKIEQIQRGEAPEKYRKRASCIVPCDWAEYSLGEIYKERKLAGDPKLPILTVSIHGGVSDGALSEDELGKKVKRIEDKTQYKTAKAGDLVFNMMRAWQGAIGVARSDGLVSPAYIVAKPEREIYPLFMDYYMKQPRMVNMIHRQSYGVTDFRLRLYWDSFAQIQISLPPLAEQKRIVETLSTQDRIIELLEKKVEQLHLLKKSYMQKMFPQPGSNEPEIRFPRFSAPWEQRKVGEVSKRVIVGLATSVTPYYREEGVPILRNLNIKENYLDDIDILFLDKSYAESQISKQIHTGDVLTVHTGYIGISCIVPEKYDKCLTFTTLITTTDNTVLEGEFLAQYLNSEIGMSAVQAVTTQGGRQNLNTNDFVKVEIRYPSLAEQRRICAVLRNIDNLITLHQRKCEEEKQKKKALMQLLLTGIVRV